ncbi:hypothetical protein FKM82_030027 [Ascaphus truei]
MEHTYTTAQYKVLKYPEILLAPEQPSWICDVSVLSRARQHGRFLSGFPWILRIALHKTAGWGKRGKSQKSDYRGISTRCILSDLFSVTNVVYIMGNPLKSTALSSSNPT